MNKTGADKIISVYWFVILFIVAGAVVFMTASFYGTPKDVTNLEARVLSTKVADCLLDGVYFKSEILNDNSFKTNFLKKCSLIFGDDKDYYTEINIHKFDSDLPENEGKKVFDFSAGNVNLKTSYLTEEKKTTKRKADMIVIHYTATSSAQRTIEVLENRGLSIHYILDKDGTIISSENTKSSALVSEEQEAWHAGCPRTGEEAKPYCHSNEEMPNSELYTQDKQCCLDVNSHSIGIEIVNLGDVCGSTGDACTNKAEINGVLWEAYPQEQIDSLAILVSGIASRYNIPLDRKHIVGHEELAPGYSVDPGKAFPWIEFMEKLQAAGNANFAGGREFYTIDKSGNQYVVKILSLIGEKNE